MYFSFFVKFLQLAMQFAVQLLLVQLLSKSAYGSYSYIVAVLGIVAVIIQQGLPELTMREVARAIAQGAGSGAHRILLLSFGMFALNISVFFVVATVFQNVFAASVGMLLPIWPQMILILLAGGVLRIIAGYYRGLGSYVIGLSAESLMFPALFLLGTMLVALLKPNLSWEDISAPINIHTVAILGLATGMSALVLFSRLAAPAATIYHKPLGIKSQYFAAFVIGAQTGTHILFTYVDIIMLTMLANLTDVAEYRVAAQLSQFVVLANIALTAYFAPRIAAAYQTDDHVEIRRIVKFNRFWSGAFAFGASAIFFAVGPWAVPFFFGNDYAPVYSLTLILIAGHFLNVAMGPLGILLNMTGHQNYTLIASIISLTVNVVLNYILIRYWGVQGAAVATAVSLMISKSTTVIFVYRLGLVK